MKKNSKQILILFIFIASALILYSCVPDSDLNNDEMDVTSEMEIYDETTTEEEITIEIIVEDDMPEAAMEDIIDEERGG